MRLFSTIGRRKIPAHKKESIAREPFAIDIQKVAFVYFPLVAGNNAVCEPLVKVGDKVKVGTRIAFRQQFSVPLFSSVSGVVTAIEKRTNIMSGRPCDHLVIANDFKMEREVPLSVVALDAPKEHIVEAIKEAGIVGLGGAGFPTWIKYNNVKGIHTVVINAVECEPYLTTDYTLTKKYAQKIVTGARYLQKAAEAPNVVIAIKEHKEAARDALIEASKEIPDMAIVEVPDRYPMGWEATLIFELFKKRYHRLPSEIGVVVNNSTTAIAVCDALTEGRVVTERLVTVSGNVVKNPGNIFVPVGTLAEVVLKEFDIDQTKEFNLLPGGPMTSTAAKDASFALQSNHGGLTLLEKVKFRTIPCLRCGACTANCPAGIQPVEIMRAFEARDYVRLEKLETMRCVDCGLCSYVCPSNIEVTEFMKKAKTLLRVNQQAGKK